MKRALLLAALIAATPAVAQQPQMDPLVAEVLANSQAEMTMHNNTVKSVNALLQAYAAMQAENAKLKADAAKTAEPPKE